MTSDDPNLHVYNSPDVAGHYARLHYLSACEHLLFQTFLKPGIAILDLAMGGGRTTPYLSGLASRYVGVDYALEMVAVCRNKFPGLEFREAHAADLGVFETRSFDAVVIAFNGMDYLTPDEMRIMALAEIHRVLKIGGLLIFSSHNPRAILSRPTWNKTKIDQVVAYLAGNSPVIRGFIKGMLSAGRALAAFIHSAGVSVVRMSRRLPNRAFWRGEGYMTDPAHGGLVTHYAVPERVVTELTTSGFRLQRIQGDDYPFPSRLYVTDWYYYVFSAAEKSSSVLHCE